MFEVNRRFLQDNSRSRFIRYVILFWEIFVISILIWQLVRILSTFHSLFHVLTRTLEDGLWILELGGLGLQSVFNAILSTVKYMTNPPKEEHSGNWIPKWLYSEAE